jgi:hypothetical protein
LARRATLAAMMSAGMTNSAAVAKGAPMDTLAKTAPA